MEPNIAHLATLIGDNARSKMLTALMSGKALTATELAIEADITPQTASTHLSKLVKGELLIVRKQGRHKYFQLHNPQVADLIENMLNLSAAIINNDVPTGPRNKRLREARICYDHLAGNMGVMLFDALIQKGWLIDSDTILTMTNAGQQFFTDLGVDFDSLKKSSRPLCKSCLDWSERRTHLAGSLGKWILDDAINRTWAEQDLDSRAIQFSPTGLKSFCKRYAL